MPTPHFDRWSAEWIPSFSLYAQSELHARRAAMSQGRIPNRSGIPLVAFQGRAAFAGSLEWTLPLC